MVSDWGIIKGYQAGVSDQGIRPEYQPGVIVRVEDMDIGMGYQTGGSP